MQEYFEEHEKVSKRKEIQCHVSRGLNTIYQTKVLPIEQKYLFNTFQSRVLNDHDFESKPMIILLGDSNRTTSFIRFLLKMDLPDVPQSANQEKVVAFVNGESTAGEMDTMSGCQAFFDQNKQFRSLADTFETDFLRSSFQYNKVQSAVLERISIVCIDGLLSKGVQYLDNVYLKLVDWFLDKAHQVLILFEADKPADFKAIKLCLASLKDFDKNIGIVLTKTNRIGSNQMMMNLNGTLMFTIGKAMKLIGKKRPISTYIGSFWNNEVCTNLGKFVHSDEEKLYKDVVALCNSMIKETIDDFMHRVQLVKVHVYLIGTISKEYSEGRFKFSTKEDKKRKVIMELNHLYEAIERENHLIPVLHFPDVKLMQEKLVGAKFSQFPRLDPEVVWILDHLIQNEIVEVRKIANGKLQPSEEKVSWQLVFDDIQSKSKRSKFWSKVKSLVTDGKKQQEVKIQYYNPNDGQVLEKQMSVSELEDDAPIQSVAADEQPKKSRKGWGKVALFSSSDRKSALYTPGPADPADPVGHRSSPAQLEVADSNMASNDATNSGQQVADDTTLEEISMKSDPEEYQDQLPEEGSSGAKRIKERKKVRFSIPNPKSTTDEESDVEHQSDDRYHDDLTFKEEFAEYACRLDRLRSVPVYTSDNEPSGKKGIKKRRNNSAPQQPLDPEPTTREPAGQSDHWGMNVTGGRVFRTRSEIISRKDAPVSVTHLRRGTRIRQHLRPQTFREEHYRVTNE